MANRRPVQQAHERAYVQHFLEWFNRAYRSDFAVVCEPNPPEAIIRSSQKTTRWLEVTTAFWNDDYARDLYSHATPDEKHIPVSPGPYHDMDQRFVQSFVSVVAKKLKKKSYVPWRDQYGGGYLVVPIEYPWFDGRTRILLKAAWKNCSIHNLRCFRSVYIAFPSLNTIRISRWSIA